MLIYQNMNYRLIVINSPRIAVLGVHLQTHTHTHTQARARTYKYKHIQEDWKVTVIYLNMIQNFVSPIVSQ